MSVGGSQNFTRKPCGPEKSSVCILLRDSSGDGLHAGSTERAEQVTG